MDDFLSLAYKMVKFFFATREGEMELKLFLAIPLTVNKLYYKYAEVVEDSTHTQSISSILVTYALN